MATLFGLHITPQVATARDQNRLRDIYNYYAAANHTDAVQTSDMIGLANTSFDKERSNAKDKLDDAIINGNLSPKERLAKIKEYNKTIKSLDAEEKDFDKLVYKLADGGNTINATQLHARDGGPQHVAPLLSPRASQDANHVYMNPPQETHIGDSLKAAALATGHGLKVAGVATGHGLKVAGVATGHALETAGVATGHALATAGVATGHALKTAGVDTVGGIGYGLEVTGNVLAAPPELIAKGGEKMAQWSGLSTPKTVPITPLPEQSQADLQAQIAALKAQNAALAKENLNLQIDNMNNSIFHVDNGTHVAPASTNAPAPFISPVLRSK